MRILAVDDDDSILSLLQRILAGSGSAFGEVEVEVALSAAEALDRISRTDDPFDCLLIDIQMPVVDGIALTRMIRETPGYSHAAILMLTAMHEKHYLDAAFAAGATDYVSKPFDFIDLRQRIRAAMETCQRKRDLQHDAIMAGELKKMGGEPKDVRLDQPVSVGEADTSIGNREFENYLIELSRRGPRAMTVVAAKIDNVERFYRGSTTETFLELIKDATAAIGAALLTESGFMSYRGSGVFLCVNEGRPSGASKGLEARVNAELRKLRGEDNRDAVRILVGDEEPLSLNSDMTAIETLSEAVGSAEDRAMSYRDLGEIPARLIGRRHLGAEQDRLDQRAFALLLNDTLRDVDDDAWSRKLKERARR